MVTRNTGLALNFRHRDRLGDIRLRGELESYRIELDRIAERTSSSDDPPPWADEASDLVDAARDALDRGDVEEGWFYLHTARRIELDALNENLEERRLRAQLILADAEDDLDTREQNLVERLLTGSDGAVRSDVSVAALREAQRILDSHNQNAHLKRRYVQEQFQALAAVGVVGTLFFVLIGSVAEWLQPSVIPGPFADGATAGVGFVPYILLAGTVGAALFGLVSSLRANTSNVQLPQTISSGWMVVSRTVTGAMSAFVLFLFLKSGLLSLGLPESPIFLLLVGVAAGYSERLAPATIETVLEKLEPAGDSGGTRPAPRSPESRSDFEESSPTSPTEPSQRSSNSEDQSTRSTKETKSSSSA